MGTTILLPSHSQYWWTQKITRARFQHILFPYCLVQFTNIHLDLQLQACNNLGTRGALVVITKKWIQNWEVKRKELLYMHNNKGNRNVAATTNTGYLPRTNKIWNNYLLELLGLYCVCVISSIPTGRVNLGEWLPLWSWIYALGALEARRTVKPAPKWTCMCSWRAEAIALRVTWLSCEHWHTWPFCYSWNFHLHILVCHLFSLHCCFSVCPPRGSGMTCNSTKNLPRESKPSFRRR